MMKKRGFTLIEMVLAIAILAASTMVASSMMINGIETYGRVTERRQALRSGRFALMVMRKQLEVIADPANHISSISSNGITFLPTDSTTYSNYSILGNQLSKDGNVLTSSLTGNSAFSFFDAAGNNTNNASNVASIQIVLEVDTGVSHWGVVSLVDRIYLRNRYYDTLSN